MNKKIFPVRIISIALVVIGVVLLALTIFTRGAVNIALPLVFIVLGGIFLIVIFSICQKWTWASLLYIPAMLLVAFGIIFLLNEVTGDWKSWAFAWLLLLAAVGIGMLLANHDRVWHPLFNLLGWGLTLAGITLFVVFGAITGGLFIQIMAAILLVAAGLSLRWLHLESILPEGLLKKMERTSGHSLVSATANNAVEELVEPLSSRELEVLRLIGAGLSNHAIAGKLIVAPSTVKTHINNIYGKLGVETRVQAINRARSLNLLDN